MKKIPNILSGIRLVVSFIFLFSDFRNLFPWAVLVALITDVLDGYLARHFHAQSTIGTWLDPLADKCFVIGAVLRLIVDGNLYLWQIATFFARDCSLILFSLFLLARGTWRSYKVASFFCGKVATSLQFIALFLLFCSISVPPILFVLLGLFGVLSFVELLLRDQA